MFTAEAVLRRRWSFCEKLAQESLVYCGSGIETHRPVALKLHNRSLVYCGSGIDEPCALSFEP